ncbi:hypothetical protein V6N13_094122 [Hibiscus sabdariffa]
MKNKGKTTTISRQPKPKTTFFVKKTINVNHGASTSSNSRMGKPQANHSNPTQEPATHLQYHSHKPLNKEGPSSLSLNDESSSHLIDMKVDALVAIDKTIEELAVAHSTSMLE